MELRDSGKTISFFLRIVFQIPTIAFSTLTMIAVSRNLGPTGRGEVSQILLLAALTSSILCTPIFLTIMNLEVSREIKSYISSSLYLFSWKNLTLVSLLNICLIVSKQSGNQEFSAESIISLNLLIAFYFIAAQIRDLLLRFHKNQIYGLDFLVQLMISGFVIALLVLNRLTVSHVIQVFVLTYGVFALVLLIVLRLKVREFEFANLIRKRARNSKSEGIQKTDSSFSKLGVLFQLSLSKDLLFGLFLLPKADFGLMSALASFWVVVRFLRPSAVIQVKVGQKQNNYSSKSSRGILGFMTRASSAIYIQAISIGIMGIVGLVLTPVLLGGGFKPSITMTIAGLTSEILLMKCLYDMSTSISKFSQEAFIFLCLVQVSFLGVFGVFGIEFSITLIWLSSIAIYLIWQILNILRTKN